MRNTSIHRWSQAIGGILIVLSGSVPADAVYQDTTQVTGGALVKLFRAIPFMPKSSKQVLEPNVTTVALRGNQLAHVSRTTSEIIDLDQETITRTDNDKKTYTVTTFDEMRQMYKDAAAKMKEAQNAPHDPASDAASQSQPKYTVTFDASYKDTGRSKTINGVLAKEQVLTMKAHVTPVTPSPNDASQSATYAVITDMWTAPTPPEMHDVEAFYARYAKKLVEGVDTSAILDSLQPKFSQADMSALFASKPNMGGAMPEMMKKISTEMAKIKGVSVFTITRVGGEDMVAPSGDPTELTAASNSGGSMLSGAGGAAAKDVAADTTSAAVMQQVGKLGSIGSVFGSSVMSAVRRNVTSSPSAASQPNSNANGNQTSGSDTVLFEMTAQKTAFSTGPASAALFQIPAGYTRLDTSSQTPMK